MKVHVIAVLAGALMTPGAASAFDWRSPNPDFETRQKSEQLHVSAGSAMARAPRHDAGNPQVRRFPPAPTFRNPYPDMRERVLRGTDY